jgi:aerobic-type carbon monoxide dehydrogenase small subunit (CoxS/CutS family)
VVELTVNGTKHRVDVDPTRTLLSVLRDELDLTGTKYGCGEGICGACAVLVDGEVALACQTGVGEVQGKKITTIEGLSTGDKLHPVQQAFVDLDAMQCGYCTPGMIMASVALLTKNPNPTAQQIATELEGHICRCGVYQRIVAAVEQAAAAMRGGAQ